MPPMSLPEDLVDAARRDREEQSLKPIVSNIDGLIRQGMGGLEAVAKGAAEQVAPVMQLLSGGELKLPTLDDLTPEWMRPKPVQAATITPAQTPATMVDGRQQQGPSMQPGEQMGNVEMANGGGNATQGQRARVSSALDVTPDEPVTSESVTRSAAAALRKAGLPAEMAPYIAGIAINEGILQPGTIARDHWSVGGVKAPGSAGVVTVPTREVINGQDVMQTASFGTFGSMQEGMDALAEFVRDSPRFGPVVQQAARSGDYRNLIAGFKERGYATDPNWVQQVNSIAAGLPVPSVPPNASQDMQRVSLTATPPSPSGASVAAPSPAPWANETVGGPMMMKADGTEDFLPGDGGTAPTESDSYVRQNPTVTTESDSYDESGPREATPGDGGYAPQVQASPDRVAETFDPDQGPREAPPGSVGSQPLPQTNNPMTYGPIQQGDVAEGPPTLGDVTMQNGGAPTENARSAMIDMGTVPAETLASDPPEQQSSTLLPLYDIGGRIIGYVQGAANAALDRMMEGPRPPQSEADRLLAQSASSIVKPVDATVSGVSSTVEQAMGVPEGTMRQAAEDVSGVLGPEQAINAARGAVRAARAVPSEVRAISAELDDVLRPVVGAVDATGAGVADDVIRQMDAVDRIVTPPSTRALPEPVQQAVQTIEEYQRQIRQQYERAADFSAALRNPDPVPVPDSPAWTSAEQQMRERFGRPIKEVESRLGEASGQVRDIRDASVRPEMAQQEFRPNDNANIGGPVQIEPQSISLNAAPGVAPSASLVADLGNAVGGGIVGTSAGAALPAETPEERRTNALIGLGTGVVAGPAVGRLLPNTGGALATFGASPNHRPPTAAQVQAAERQAARRGQMLNRSVTVPGSDVPLSVRAATAATDDRAGLRWAEDMLSEAAGSPRMRENDPARPSTLSRVNAGAVANERITNELEPAVVNAGRAGLQDELPQYLEDMHQRDILDEFYRREHQRVLDDRAQRIATARANNASPAVIQRMQAKAQADAEAAALKAMRNRQGSNPEMSYEAIEARLQAQEQRVSAAGQKQELDDAAQAIWDHNAETRQRLVDAGEMDPADAAHFAQVYPHYVPTVPISHLDARGGQAVSASSGPRVSRGNQGVVKALEDVGTSGERLNPIVASRNATVRAERAIQKNNVARAFAQMMDDALHASPGTMSTNTATHRTFLGGGSDVTFFDNGKPVTISVPKAVADGLEAAANMGMSSNGLSSIWKRIMGAVTSTMTAARASFLPVNLLRDAQDFATRTMAREGGPQNLPSIMATWLDEAGRAAADIAVAQANPRGLAGAAMGAVTGAAAGDETTTPAERVRNAVAGGVAGTFLLGANRVKPTGTAREFMARGGGSGAASADWRVGQRWYRDVMRDGGVTIKTPADAARFFSDWGADILSLQGVKGINERTELISRTAAMRRVEKGGSGPVEAMVAGRDATVDFDRAGTWTRMVNGIVPFFNATVQGGAQTARAFRQNPVAFTASIAATVAPVMLGAEAWNRSDPERARVYDDVPQYIKDTGLVVVTPWAGADNRGERPNYVWIPTGMTTPFVVGMRAAMEGLPGLEPVAGRVGTRADASTPEKWLDVFEQVAQVFSPIRGDSAASVASNFVPPIAKQVVELGQNKDMFRGNPIASDTADERASTFGRRVAEGANVAGRAVGNDFLQEVRPSQVDYLARQLPAYGDIITGASDMVAPNGYKQAEDRPIQNAPFVGGLAARFVRDTGGASLQRAQDAALSEPVREIFEAAGMRPSDLSPVPSRWKNGTLTRDEQLRWQEAFDVEVGRSLAAARRDPKWRDPATREQAVKDAMSQARERAAERARLPAADVMERRIRAEQRMKAS